MTGSDGGDTSLAPMPPRGPNGGDGIERSGARRWAHGLALLSILAALVGCSPTGPPAATAVACPALPTLRVVVGSVAVLTVVGTKEWVTACLGHGAFRGYAADAMPAALIASQRDAPATVSPGATGRLVFDLAPVPGTVRLLRWDDQAQRYESAPTPLGSDGSFVVPTLPGAYSYGVRADWNPLPGFHGDVEYGFQVEVR